jgi:hypothetical protein
MSTLIISTQHSTRSPSQSHFGRERNKKSIQIRKEEVKLLMLTDGVILYGENLNHSTKRKKFRQLKNKYQHTKISSISLYE